MTPSTLNPRMSGTPFTTSRERDERFLALLKVLEDDLVARARSSTMPAVPLRVQTSAGTVWICSNLVPPESHVDKTYVYVTSGKMPRRTDANLKNVWKNRRGWKKMKRLGPRHRVSCCSSKNLDTALKYNVMRSFIGRVDTGQVYAYMLHPYRVGDQTLPGTNTLVTREELSSDGSSSCSFDVDVRAVAMDEVISDDNQRIMAVVDEEFCCSDLPFEIVDFDMFINAVADPPVEDMDWDLLTTY